jgi:hypothetical protein
MPYFTELFAAGRAGWKTDAESFEVSTDGLRVAFLQWQVTFVKLSLPQYFTQMWDQIRLNVSHVLTLSSKLE